MSRKKIMARRLIPILMLLLLVSGVGFADTVTFPNNSTTFTENGHAFTSSGVGGNGGIWSGDYRSAPYCLGNNSSYGSVTLSKTNGTFQVNSFWVKASWSGFSINIYGRNNGGGVYSTSATVSATYTQINLSNWTGIDELRITMVSNGSIMLDDIDYTSENVAPTDISLSNDNVDDGDPSGTTVGDFSSTDVEDGGGHTYTLVSGTGSTDNGSFSIDGSSLKTGFVADYDTKNSYSVRVRSTDSGGLWREEVFAVTVNPAAPAQYVVTDAEIAAYNGTYDRDGSYNGYPMYNKGGTHYLFHFNCTNTWSLDTDYNTGGPPAFNVQDDVTLPPASGYWQGCWGVESSSVNITEASSLPVTLSSFSAVQQGRTVRLTWVTESETDHLGFIVERKAEGLSWTTVASYKSHDELKGTGNSSDEKEYLLTDTDVILGLTYQYRLSEVDTRGIRNTADILSITVEAVPASTALLPASPNPFNPTTKIAYQLAEDLEVSLKVVDMMGRTVQTLIHNTVQPAGSYSVHWNGQTRNGLKAASGNYLLLLKAGDVKKTEKITLLK